MTGSDFILILYTSFFLCTSVFSFLINGLFLKFSKTLGIRNVNDTVIRWGSLSKPALGGISFYIIFLFSGVTYLLLFGQQDKLLDIKFLGLLSACTLGFLLGLADDAYNTKPLLKFIAQFTCGTILVASGTIISFFDSEILNVFLTIFWVIALMNSINMLDNMDGITTIVSIGISLCALSVLTVNNAFLDVYFLILIGLIASLTGFLFFNWHPSKMYMGDTGSQFLGVFLAAVGIEFFWNIDHTQTPFTSVRSLLLVCVVFILPIADTATVVINRVSRGQSPFVGGKDHTTHHLSYMGLTDRKVAALFGFIGLINFALCLILFNWEISDLVLNTILSLYIVIVGGFLFSVTKIKRMLPS